MKKLVSILLASSIAVLLSAQPQNRHGSGAGGHANSGIEKIRAERVAFITSEVGLTAEEAQAFWPVYNRIEEQQKELMKAERSAYIALSKALADGQGDVQKLLDAYIKAKAANVNLHVANVKDYSKVLPTEKVARLFTCEEKFRRQQIGRLGSHGKQPQRAPISQKGKGRQGRQDATDKGAGGKQ